MNDVICPHCKTAFKVDESGFADILKQVRDQEFDQELKNRLVLADNEKDSAVKLAEANIKNSLQKELSEKDKQLAELKANSDAKLADQLSKKDIEISEMKSNIEKAETEKKLEISDAIKEIEKERDKLTHNLKIKETERDSAIKLAEANIKHSLQEEIANKEKQLIELKAKSDTELAEKLADKEKKIASIESKIQNAETEKKLLEKSIKQQFSNQLISKDEAIKMRDDEIDRLKEFKQKLSTKMVGETLEQHCETEFNKLRATAFQNSHFEKDNDSSGGTKGDFIYKENDDEGNEIISIMFEMKNESDETTTKKKNEDFFTKLDKDRNEKKCEYSVLVSLLEPENELYNNGIIDVSHRFEKMYVIRPQFFIPIITLLRNAALNSLKYKKELNLIRNQNIDVTNFEDKIIKFREGFAKNYESASNHFEKAIKDIDRSIATMERVKKELTTSENQLRLANQKAEGLTIRKLTYANPTMKEKFNKTD